MLLAELHSQYMQNLVGERTLCQAKRSAPGRNLGLPVTTGNFCQILLYIQ